jgi:hypothetical protein
MSSKLTPIRSESDTFAFLMHNSEGLRDWQRIVFVELHPSPSNAAATVVGPYHLYDDPELIARIKAVLN